MTDHRETDQPRDPLGAIRRRLTEARLPVEIGASLRPLLPTIAQRITADIEGSLASRRDPPAGAVSSLLSDAVGLATLHFGEIVVDPAALNPAIARAFRYLGSSEAEAGRDLEAMRAEYHLAAGVIWRTYREAVATIDMDARASSVLADVLVAYIDYLLAEASAGHATSTAARGPVARRRLAQALLTHESAGRIERLAAKASWPLPERVVVVVIDQPHTPQGVLGLVPHGSLLHHRPSQLTLIVPSAQPFVVDPDNPPECKRLAHSWPIPLCHTADAWRWARTTLRLADNGVIHDSRVVACTDHKALLLVHTDPALITQIRKEALAPLDDVSDHHRRQLERTLLSSLRTHSSAPQLARELGVHQQTVRHRLRVLRNLFGERLSTPTGRLELQLALEAVFNDTRHPPDATVDDAPPHRRPPHSARPRNCSFERDHDRQPGRPRCEE